MAALRRNTRLSGRSHFEMSPLPHFHLYPDAGILPMRTILEDRIGTEVALFLFAKTPFIGQIAEIKPFNLLLKTGVARTENGPLMFLLFYLPNPKIQNTPFTMLDCHINPFDPEMLGIWRDLSKQTHWHLILLDGEQQVIDLLEFENNYDLDMSIDQVQAACRGMIPGDFDLAKQEFIENYTLEDIFNL